MDGKIAIVTGAAGGIGEATTRLFVEEGARVVITDLQQDKGQALAATLGKSAHYMTQDVANADEWSNVIVETEQRFGALTVLVNIAGVGLLTTPIQECSNKEYRCIVDINQYSFFLGMKAVVPSICKVGVGSIVNINFISWVLRRAKLPS